MELYGSWFSPYVRRTRLVLAQQPYEFVCINIFEQAGRDILVRLNPTRKVPMLVDGEQVIFDSGVIYRYLAHKFLFSPLSWEDENNISVINATNDSLVELYLCKRSGLAIEEDKLFFNLQRERIAATFSLLADKVSNGEFSQWNYPAICLYCLVDWVNFRELYDLSQYPALLAFKQRFADEAAVAETDPKLG